MEGRASILGSPGRSSLKGTGQLKLGQAGSDWGSAAPRTYLCSCQLKQDSCVFILPFLRSFVGFNKDLRDALLCKQETNSGAVIRVHAVAIQVEGPNEAFPPPNFLSGLSQREFLPEKEQTHCQGREVLC